MKSSAPGLAVVVTTLLAAAIAAAASLSLASATLGASRIATPRCTATGLSVLPNLTAGNVASVTVGTVPAGCASATLQAAVDNGTTSSTGSTTVPAGGGTVTVTLAIPVALSTNVRTDIVFVGP